MSKHDLQARPIYHRIRDSIEAHLTIVLAALAVSNRDWESWSHVGTPRRYRLHQAVCASDVTSATPDSPRATRSRRRTRASRRRIPLSP